MPHLDRKTVVLAALVFLVFSAPGIACAEAGDKMTPVVDLTQTGCQFVEPEGADHQFSTSGKADCVKINEKTGADRRAAAQAITLKPGKYVFRVTNKNVPYELGFWLRSHDYDGKNPLHKLSKTSISGGGLHEGVTREYEVDLKPGRYLYSCPLNATPNYPLIVTEESP